MVNLASLAEPGWAGSSLLRLSTLLAQSAEKPPILQMPSQHRAKAIALVCLFIFIGAGLVALAWVGARITRRYMNRTARSTVKKPATPRDDDWSDVPLDQQPELDE